MSVVDRQARERIQALEERVARRDREVAELSLTVSRLAATVEGVRASVPRPSPAAAPSPPTPAPSALSVTAPKALTAPAVALPAAPAGFASLIVADFPALFAEFRGRRFTLLWRGSRDGFGADGFHRRCDGHAPTLTLLRDTDGNIFGGFTPVKWESRQHNGKWGREDNRYKADPSLESFLFTLKNPHNFQARKFALMKGRKDSAIRCDSCWAPDFYDIHVSESYNAKARSYSSLGCTYANDTDLDGNTVLTGSCHFTVKEIEVFEIAD
jgi:hypothetical protein